MTPLFVLFILLNAGIAFALAIVVASAAGRLGFPRPTATERRSAIDGMRGYLAMGVMVCHFILWTQVERLGGEWAPPAINFFNQLGAGAVSLFFMVTGYLFYPRIVAGLRKTNWVTTLTGRAFRILPLVIFTVAAISLIIKTRGATGRPELSAYLMWLTSFDEPPLLGYPKTGRINAYVLWSLWYEWVFYLTILPLAALTRDLLPKRVPSWIIPIVLLVFSVIGRVATSWRLFELLPYFAIGMLAFELQRSDKIAGFFRRPNISLISAGSLILGMSLAPSPDGPAVFLFAFFFLAVACGNDYWGLLRLRGSLVLGDCSFSIYLWHGIVLSILFVEAKGILGWFATPWLPAALPFAVVIVVIVSIASYVLIERPMMAVGKRVADRFDRLPGRDRHAERRFARAELEVAPCPDASRYRNGAQ